jgi:4-azaleucine resistance transporter AzlC
VSPTRAARSTLAPALSLSAFAGSLELLLVGMIASAAPLIAVAITVFVVNFRHVFYAFSFPRHLVRNRFARLYATYALIDEVYAVNAALPASHRSGTRILAMQVACQIYWVGGGLVGVLLARLLPGPIKGLEFALCALFTVLTLDAFRSRREIPSVLLAGAGIGIGVWFESMGVKVASSSQVPPGSWVLTARWVGGSHARISAWDLASPSSATSVSSRVPPTRGSPVQVQNQRASRSDSVMLAHASSIDPGRTRSSTRSRPIAVRITWPVGVGVMLSPFVIVVAACGVRGGCGVLRSRAHRADPANHRPRKRDWSRSSATP